MDFFKLILGLLGLVIVGFSALVFLRYLTFRRAVDQQFAKLNNIYQKRKKLLDDFKQGMHQKWENHQREFQEFTQKIGFKIDSQKQASAQPSSQFIDRVEGWPVDMAVISTELIANHVTFAGDFKNAAERFVQTEFESSSSFAEELQGRLTSDWSSRVFGPDGDMLEGWINGIKGHMGEAHVLEQLQQEGLTVDLPESGSQTGFDLLIGDGEFQVKTVSSFSSVADHLQKYPDIPVIFNADASSIPDGVPTMDAAELAEHIENGTFDFGAVALEGFEVAEFTDAASDGMDSALGNADVGIPFATIAVSSIRELKTLHAGHTNMPTVIRNVAVDTVAKGGAMALGAKAGALVGSLLLPGVGTAVGGMVGGLVGGLIGSRGAKALRESEANASQFAFSQEHKNTQVKMSQALEGSKQTFHRIEQSYRAERERMREATSQAIERFESQVLQGAKELSQAFHENFLDAKESFAQLLKKQKRFAWLWEPKLAAQHQARAQFLSQESQNELAVVLTDSGHFASCLQLLAAQDADLSNATQALSAALLTSQRQAVAVSRQHAERLKSEFHPKQTEALETSIDALEALARSLSCAIAEARKAGLSTRAAALGEFESKLKSELERLKNQQQRSNVLQKCA